MQYVLLLSCIAASSFLLFKDAFIQRLRTTKRTHGGEQEETSSTNVQTEPLSLDIGEVADAWQRLEDMGKCEFTRDQVIAYLDLQTTYQQRQEASR